MIKVKVGIPESFKVGWYPPKKTGSSHLKTFFYCTPGIDLNSVSLLAPLVFSVALATMRYYYVLTNNLFMTSKGFTFMTDETGFEILRICSFFTINSRP